MKPAWIFFLASFCLLCFSDSDAQVPVAFAPPIHFQFFNANGTPLANGKIYTYAAGTTTLQNTYVDASGTTENADPILLDATGSPSNGSNQTGIFLANLSYKFVAYDANSVFQWSVDNVSSYFGLLNSANTWTAAQTFTSTITDTLTDNQMIFGGTGNQTTLDFPPPSGNITLHMPNTADTVVGRQTTDMLSNKNLIQPAINGVTIANSPGTYIAVANATSPTGTTGNTLTILTGAPSTATIATTTTTSGVVGITVLGAGITGNATIQQSGIASCVFDGATTAGDYVTISSTTAGDCHDAGTSAPVSSQNIGQVLATNGSAGSNQIVINSGGSSAGSQLACQNTTPTTVNANTTSSQTVLSCAVPAVFNVLGRTFRVTGSMLVATSSSTSTVSLFINSGASPALTINFTSSTSATASYQESFSITCSITTPGSSAVMSCTGPMSENTVSGSPTVTLSNGSLGATGGNLTGSSFTIGTACTFGTGSTSNSCTGNQLFVEQLN